MARTNVKDWLTEEGLTKIEGWARDGLTDDQISHNIGCSLKTLYNWKKKHLPILQSLKRGKEVVDRQVENALLKRALGYSYDEITNERLEVAPGFYEMVETKRVTKIVEPNTTAQIFWLKNRKPEEWREKQEVKHSGEVTNKNVDLSGLSEKELRKLADIDS